MFLICGRRHICFAPFRKEEIERESARLRAELDDAKGDLAKSDESRKALRTEIR